MSLGVLINVMSISTEISLNVSFGSDCFTNGLWS